MTILASDIKLLESERMRDTSDGGGRQTGVEIVSGEMGNVFPKISRADATSGRVRLRKIYLAVRAANNDTYAGAHMIISDAPDNARVSCLLFSTGSAFDMRTQARDRIESYVVAGPLSRMRLHGTQLIGQQAILAYQAESEPLPDVGQVLVLSVENSSGVVSSSQYVRITDVTHEVRTFTDASGDFTRRVLTLKIGSRLNQTFVALEATRVSTDSSATKLRQTQVADASQYYGIQPLTEAANINDLTLRLASVYAPLVPSTQRETGVSLASIAAVSAAISCGDSIVPLIQRGMADDVYGTATSGGMTFTLRHLPARGTAMVYLGGDVPVPHNKWTDDGNGELTFTHPTLTSRTGGGTIDYESGVVRIWCNEHLTGYPLLEQYVVAVAVGTAAHTINAPVTLATRGTVYTETLSPIPAPGTLIVDFRALGRWYRLRDNGAGELVANDPSEGTGSVDYVTGASVVTLGALPDVDSAVIYSWGSPVHTAIRAGASTDAGTTLDLDYTLTEAPVVPGSHTVTWVVNGTNRTATDSSGVFTGTGMTGTINYATGAVKLKFSTPPDVGTNLANAYTWRSGTDLIGTATSATITGGTFTVPGAAPFRNGGTMQFQVELSSGASGSLAAYITTGGQVRVSAQQIEAPSGMAYRCADQQVGTFNATTGQVTLSPGTIALSNYVWSGTWRNQTASWTVATPAKPILSVSDIVVERDTSYTGNAITGEVVVPSTVGLRLDLTTTVADSIVPASLLFTATGKTYVDRNGTLYTDISPTTGSGTPAGSIDYATGMCTLTTWANNLAVSRSVLACLTLHGQWTAVDASFRTAGSPIRPASLYVQVTAVDGTLITGTSDVNGVITGANMRGTVQQDMGVVFVEFGALVEGEWVPREVLPSTLRYNCVVITNLPLDPELLGLDPVRLPADGRVPIYRPGDMVVLHNTANTALTNPVAASTTYALPRGDLYSCTLLDAAGLAVDTALYSVDLVAGSVTMAAGWTGGGYTQPLQARHRVEDMAMLTDVQINGQVAIAAPLLHAYPADASYLSGALRFGDMQAIVTNVFDQATWTGVWSDALIGSQATAQFDDINYPVTCLNQSAVTERWRINFTTTTAFQVIGENLGVIATGSTATATTPLNPVTGEPYFNIPAAGWGSGWAAGNQLRFNTVGASGPTWIAQTILAGAALTGDSFDIEGRGDVD